MVDKQEDIEMRLESLQADMRNKQEELSMMKDAVEKQSELIEYGKQQLSIKNRMHEIAQEQFEMIAPVWKFQTDEEYNSLRRELSDIEHKNSMRELETNLTRGEHNLKNYEGQVESLTEGIAVLEGKISALMEEIDND